MIVGNILREIEVISTGEEVASYYADVICPKKHTRKRVLILQIKCELERSKDAMRIFFSRAGILYCNDCGDAFCMNKKDIKIVLEIVHEEIKEYQYA